jgi:hypothetical protein
LEYEVTVDPDELFATSEVVTVTVSVSDHLGNALIPPDWSFTVEESVSPQTVILHPSGLAANPGGYWTVPVADQWADYLDTHDGDTTYAGSNTGPAGAELYLDMDTASVLADASIEDVTMYVYARYVSGFSPTPPPIAGTIDLGYKTGTNTVWTNGLGLDASGDYNLAGSGTYTTDSDGGSLELADVEALQLAVERRLSGSSPLRITEAYVVVTYVPGVSGTSFGRSEPLGSGFTLMSCTHSIESHDTPHFMAP